MLHKCSILKVAGVFFDEPSGSHYLMEISKKIKIAHTSVKKHLAALKKEGIINKFSEDKGKRKFPLYKADINSKEYRDYKKIYNLLRLKGSGLIDFLEGALMPKSIVLFGSYRKGEDMEGSDIDLFVGCKEEKIEVDGFERILSRSIQLHFREDFKKYPKELKNNIANGIVLRGYLEAF